MTCQSHQDSWMRDRSTLHLTEVVYIQNIIFDGVLKSRQEVKTANIKIKADPTKVMENEVTNSVCMLDRVFVAIKSGKKPGVLTSNKFAGLICPEHVLKMDHMQ